MSDTPRPIVIANWKMYLGYAESVRAARAVRTLLARTAGRGIDVVVCPAFPVLESVAQVLRGSRIGVGVQDLHPEAAGPYTGDVSVALVRGRARFAIVGHSERRRAYGETDALVAAKALRAIRSGISPIVCVGETLEEREQGETIPTLRRQASAVVAALPALSLVRSLLVYEPVWAISRGPGKPSPQPRPEEAVQLIGLLRKVAADRHGTKAASRLRILYGGSVDARTVGPFSAEPGVDGVLVGAASTAPVSLAAITREVLRCHS